MKRPRMTDEEKTGILKMIADGKVSAEIAKETGRSQSAICRLGRLTTGGEVPSPGPAAADSPPKARRGRKPKGNLKAHDFIGCGIAFGLKPIDLLLASAKAVEAIG